MESTAKRRPGRPKRYVDLVQRVMMIEFDTDQEAIRLSEETGRSVSDIYREWINKGRKSALANVSQIT